jgi:uncharacterized protein
MQPTVSARENFADELRGFALLGIVVVNAPFLGISSMGFTDSSIASSWDRFAAMFIVAFAQAKFYVLFAFLFGYSTSFFLKHDEPYSSKRFVRRLLGLAIFGILHAIFFFPGDILLVYALLGTGLLWFTQKKEKTCWIVAFASITVWVVLLLLVLVAALLAPEAFTTHDPSLARFDQALRGGTFLQATFARVNAWPTFFILISVLNGLCVLAMFAIGHIAGRQKVLAEPERWEPLWKIGSRVGLLFGLPASMVAAWLAVGPGASFERLGARELGGVLLGFVLAPLLTWGYVAWLHRLRTRFANALAWFRRSGRMSLTGYVSESALLSLVFCGYGLGWFGQLGTLRITIVAIGVWCALDLLAHLWLRNFRYGPLEQALRWWVQR